MRYIKGSAASSGMKSPVYMFMEEIMTMKFAKIALVTAAAIGAMAPAMANAKAGDWIVRARAIMIAPTDGGNNGDVTGIAGATVNVDNAITPEVDFTYMATDNIGFELIAATAKHHAKGAGILDGAGNLVNTWVLPPTLTAQWHFAPEAKVRPYIGAGINYTMFYNEKATSTLDGALGGDTKAKLKNDWGWAVQAGVDIDLTEKFFLNLDVKYIDINTKATLTTGSTVRTVKVDLDPIVAGVGFGMRF